MNLLTQLHTLLPLMKVEVLIVVIQLFSKMSRLAVGLTQPHIYWVPGPLSAGIKWPPPTADVKNEWTYISTSPYVFMAHTGKTLHFLCNLPVCNVMHSKQPAFSTITLLSWRQKQQGALECCYISTRLYGIKSQRIIILTFITISTILHFNTNNTTEHIHISHNLQKGVTKKLDIM
jgi:hypothetical protein